MRTRFTLVLWCCLYAVAVDCAAWAQEGSAPKAAGPKRSITVITPGEGAYLARLLPGPEGKRDLVLPQGPFRDARFVVEYDPAELGKGGRIAIDSEVTGTVAIRPLGETDRLELRRSDFDHIRSVDVRLTYDGKPVQTAIVELTARGAKPLSKQVTPPDRGLARFEDVPAGKAKLTLRYGSNLTETRDVELLTDRAKDGIVISAALTNPAPTIADSEQPAQVPKAAVAETAAPTVAGRPQPMQPAPAQQGGSLLDGLLGNLIGLAIIAGLIYVLYRWALSGGMAATLKKAGIEVSGLTGQGQDAGAPWEPNRPVEPVVSDPTLCPFCGQKKDAAGGCACSLAPGAAVATAAAVGASPQPRLVATVGTYAGSIFPLTLAGEGASVGREASNAVALTSDTTVSRRHALISEEQGAYVVTDLGSSNGVYVNGVKIAGKQVLAPGDEVQIGNTRFRFEV